MPALPSLDPRDLVERTRQEVGRNALRARNGFKLAAGLDRPKVAQTPKDVVWRRDRCELWRYRNDGVRYSPPLFIVFSLLSRSYILDLAPGNSFIEHLRDAGFDVFLLDWGITEERDAANTLEDYCDDYIPAALHRAQEICGCDEINVLGYCFGGDLALLSVGHNHELPVRSLTTIATPVDMSEIGLIGEMFREGRLSVDEVVDDTGNIPPDVIKQAFRVLKPTQEVGRYANLLEKLWDDRYVSAYQAMAQWTNDHVPFPGAAARQCVDMLLRCNALTTGELSLGGDTFSPADITCPLLNVVAMRDHIVPPPSALPLIDLVGSADRDELRLDAGHIGLAVGRSAAKVTIPKIIDFLARRSERLAEPTGSSHG